MLEKEITVRRCSHLAKTTSFQMSASVLIFTFQVKLLRFVLQNILHTTLDDFFTSPNVLLGYFFIVTQNCKDVLKGYSMN